MKNTMSIFIPAVILSFISCTNPFIRHYIDLTDNKILPLDSMIISYDGDPKIIWTNHFDKKAYEIEENGYIAIGISKFNDSVPPFPGWRGINSAHVEDPWAFDAAKEKHAELVLISRDYNRTRTSYLFQDISGESSTRHLFHKHIALFWSKSKPTALGVRLRDITIGERQRIGSNKGCAVFIVRKDSPAYHGNIIPNDIITHIDNKHVRDKIDAAETLLSKAGTIVTLTLVRGNTVITKTVELLGD